MSLPSRRLRFIAGVLGTALATHLLLFVPAPLLVQTAAALVLTMALPGLLLVEWLLATHDAPLEPLERGLYAIGAGYAMLVLIALYLSYLPGGLPRWLMLAGTDLLLAVLLALLVWRSPREPTPKTTRAWPALLTRPTRRWIIVGLLALIILAGVVRLTNIGYAEFHGDEARATLRAAAVIQGYDDVLFLHRKGPTEILIPTVVYTLTGRLTEATARLPFAIANIAGIVALFVLGWRLFGPIAGWAAALLLTFDGYLIAFARIVQYQSIVFLMSVLTVLILYRLTREPAALGRYLTLAALLLATGLLSHNEAGFVALPCLYLLLRIHKHDVSLVGIARTAATPGVLGIAVLSSFYIPFVVHPQFAVTLFYITNQRIGGQFPYNNLETFFIRSTFYSTTYYLILLTLLSVAALIFAYWRGLKHRALPVIGAVLIGLVLTAVNPIWLTVAGTDFTVVFFGVVLLLAVFMPALSVGQRTVWLWISAPLLLALFFTVTPRTHVYTFFIPWVLLAGSVVEHCLVWMQRRTGRKPAIAVGTVITIIGVVVFGLYAYLMYVSTEVELAREWETRKPAGYWTVYESPDRYNLYGFPFKEGWKTFGVLNNKNTIDGVYASNQKDEWVTDWYTRGAWRCRRDHEYYVFAEDLEVGEEELRDERERLRSEDYVQVGLVTVNAGPGLEIYRRGIVDSAETQTYDNADYARTFDTELAGPYFPLSEPTVAPRPDYDVALGYRFGDSIELEGYTVEPAQVAPGETIRVTLYWRALHEPAERYKVFNQVRDTEDAMIGQRDGEPRCDAWPTTNWRAGDLVIDQYAVPLTPDTAAGTYPLIVGMYPLNQPETPLRVYNEAGQEVGQSVELTQITVSAN